jgi:hypothetical protein
MINGSWFVATNPTGEMTGSQYQNSMKRSEADYRAKHHPNNYRQFGNIFTLQDSPYKEQLYENGHPTIVLSDLQNYNATSKGVAYYKEHETNKMLHHPTTKHIYTGINHRNTKIIDEIDAHRKTNIKYHYPEHSMQLTPIIK